MAAEAGIDTRPRTQVEVAGHLQLEFVEDRLDAIALHQGVGPAHVAGLPLFAGDPLPALRHLCALNGAPARVKGPDCLFAAIFVKAHGFLARTRDGRWRADRPGTPETAAQTLTLRAGPRDPVEDLSAHLPWTGEDRPARP